MSRLIARAVVNAQFDQLASFWSRFREPAGDDRPLCYNVA
jgi:hypothetical protein